MLGILAVLLKTPNSIFEDTNVAAAQPPQLVCWQYLYNDQISQIATYNGLHLVLQLWKGYFQQKGAWWLNYSNNKILFNLSSPTSPGGIPGRVKFGSLWQKTTLQTVPLQPLCPTSSKGFTFQWARVCGNIHWKMALGMNGENQAVKKLGGGCLVIPLGKQKHNAPSVSEDLVTQKLQRGCGKMDFGWEGY